MKDKEFGLIELLRLKYRREDQIILTFCKFGFTQKLDPTSFNLPKFQDSNKSTPDSCRNDWNQMNDENLGPYNVYDWNTEIGGQNNSDILQNRFAPEIRAPFYDF